MLEMLAYVTVNSENIALVKFLRVLRLALDAKLRFAMVSTATSATASTPYCGQFAKLKKRKSRFSVNSQNLLHTIFCESTVF